MHFFKAKLASAVTIMVGTQQSNFANNESRLFTIESNTLTRKSHGDEALGESGIYWLDGRATATYTSGYIL